MHFVIHVSAAIIKEKRLLLVREAKKQNYGKWNLPGGHLEPGERLVAGVSREVHEETGLTVATDGLVGIYTGLGNQHFIHYVFSASIVGGTTLVPGSDILEVEWFSIDECLEGQNIEILNHKKLQAIITTLTSNQVVPLHIIREDISD